MIIKEDQRTIFMTSDRGFRQKKDGLLVLFDKWKILETIMLKVEMEIEMKI